MALMIGYLFTVILIICMISIFTLLVRAMLKKEDTRAIFSMLIALIVASGVSISILHKAEEETTVKEKAYALYNKRD